jgi:hypothetical protein
MSSEPIPFPPRPGIRPVAPPPLQPPPAEPEPARRDEPIPADDEDPPRSAPVPAAASLSDMAEATRRISLEGAACLVDILANAVERAPEGRITRARMLGLLRETAAGIRELKMIGSLT